MCDGREPHAVSPQDSGPSRLAGLGVRRPARARPVGLPRGAGLSRFGSTWRSGRTALPLGRHLGFRGVLEEGRAWGQGPTQPQARRAETPSRPRKTETWTRAEREETPRRGRAGALSATGAKAGGSPAAAAGRQWAARWGSGSRAVAYKPPRPRGAAGAPTRSLSLDWSEPRRSKY